MDLVEKRLEDLNNAKSNYSNYKAAAPRRILSEAKKLLKLGDLSDCKVIIDFSKKLNVIKIKIEKLNNRRVFKSNITLYYDKNENYAEMQVDDKYNKNSENVAELAELMIRFKDSLDLLNEKVFEKLVSFQKEDRKKILLLDKECKKAKENYYNEKFKKEKSIINSIFGKRKIKALKELEHSERLKYVSMKISGEKIKLEEWDVRKVKVTGFNDFFAYGESNITAKKDDIYKSSKNAITLNGGNVTSLEELNFLNLEVDFEGYINTTVEELSERLKLMYNTKIF